MKRKIKIPYHVNDLKPGGLIMRAGTVTPERLEVESEGFCEGWEQIRNSDGETMDRTLRGVGWNMFYLADAMQAVALGSFDQETVRTATHTLLHKMQPQMFNCVELTEVSAKHFAGIPYVHLTGHARHIQRDEQIGTLTSRRNEIARTALEEHHVKT